RYRHDRSGRHLQLGSHLRRRRQQQRRHLRLRRRAGHRHAPAADRPAFGLTANVTSVLGLVLVNVPPLPDTGSISTTTSSTTSTPCVATLGGLVSADVLCANVTTVAFPGKSTASASVADATVDVPGIPVVTLRAV